MSFLRFKTFLALSIACWTLASVAYAQSATATINGVVRDSGGASVPEAQITVTNQDTGIKAETKTTGDGDFSMPGLPSGNYEVSVAKEGFQTYAEKNIFVGPTVVRSVNATLTIGQVSTSVIVDAQANQVQTTTSQVSNYVGQQQVEELPLNGRNYTEPLGVNARRGQSERWPNPGARRIQYRQLHVDQWHGR
ncbi:MAG TPA: hypothetical protein DEQ47_02515 [Solibacterales bacterium]|nr:hypothetical protein [Bryobacterales bacterium]